MKSKFLILALVGMLFACDKPQSPQDCYNEIETVGGQIVGVVDATLPILVQEKGADEAKVIVHKIAMYLGEAQRAKLSWVGSYNLYGGNGRSVATVSSSALNLLATLDELGVRLPPGLRKALAYAPVALALLPQNPPEVKIVLKDQRNYTNIESHWRASIDRLSRDLPAKK